MKLKSAWIRRTIEFCITCHIRYMSETMKLGQSNSFKIEYLKFVFQVKSIGLIFVALNTCWSCEMKRLWVAFWNDRKWFVWFNPFSFFWLFWLQLKQRKTCKGVHNAQMSAWCIGRPWSWNTFFTVYFMWGIIRHFELNQLNISFQNKT